MMIWWHCVKLATVRVQLIQLKDEMEESVQQQDFQRAAELKEKISDLETSRQTMISAAEPATTEVRTEKAGTTSCFRQFISNNDGTTILPWSSDKPLARDVTVPDTYAEAHVSNTSMETGAAVSQQDQQIQPAIHNSHFQSSGSMGHHQAVDLVHELGRWATNITGDSRKTTYLAVAVISGLVKGEHGLVSEHVHSRLVSCSQSFLTSVFSAHGFVLAGH